MRAGADWPRGGRGSGHRVRRCVPLLPAAGREVKTRVNYQADHASRRTRLLPPLGLADTRPRPNVPSHAHAHSVLCARRGYSARSIGSRCTLLHLVLISRGLQTSLLLTRTGAVRQRPSETRRPPRTPGATDATSIDRRMTRRAVGVNTFAPSVPAPCCLGAQRSAAAAGTLRFVSLRSRH